MTHVPLLIIQKEVNVIIKSDDALTLDVNVFHFVCLRDIDIFYRCHFPHISDEMRKQCAIYNTCELFYLFIERQINVYFKTVL